MVYADPGGGDVVAVCSIFEGIKEEEGCVGGGFCDCICGCCSVGGFECIWRGDVVEDGVGVDCLVVHRDVLPGRPQHAPSLSVWPILHLPRPLFYRQDDRCDYAVHAPDANAVRLHDLLLLDPRIFQFYAIGCVYSASEGLETGDWDDECIVVWVCSVVGIEDVGG